MIGSKFNQLTVVGEGERAYRSKYPTWICLCDCGNTVVVRRNSLTTGHIKSCGCVPRKQKKGSKGRFLTRDGYVRVMVPGHPRANCQGYVLEHILVKERALGRPITRSQSVHHINGIRTDNRPENLELWESSHCAGQREDEKIEFYVSQLEAATEGQINKCLKRLAAELTRRIIAQQ